MPYSDFCDNVLARDHLLPLQIIVAFATSQIYIYFQQELHFGGRAPKRGLTVLEKESGTSVYSSSLRPTSTYTVLCTVMQLRTVQSVKSDEQCQKLCDLLVLGDTARRE